MTTGVRGRPATGQKMQIGVRVHPETFERIRVRADEEFCTMGEVASATLESNFGSKGGDGSPAASAAPKSGLAGAREREKDLDIQIKEMRVAKERGEVLTIEQVVTLYEKEMAVVRSRLLAIPQQMVGLSPEQMDDLKNAVADAMADVAGEAKDTWDDLSAES